MRMKGIAGRLTAGFVVLTGAVVATAWIGVSTLGRTSSDVAAMADMSSNLAIGEKARFSLSMMQMNVKDYLISNDQQDLDEFDEWAAAHKKYYQTSHENFEDEGRRALLAQVDGGVLTYVDGFAEVRSIIPERNRVRDEVMVKAGKDARRKVYDLLAEAQGIEAVRALGEGIQHLMLTRFYAERLARTGKPSYLERTTLELGLTRDSLDVADRSGIDTAAARADLDRFEGAVVAVNDLMTRRNAVVRETLDVVGPRLTSIWGEIDESLVADTKRVASDGAKTATAGVTTLVLAGAVAGVLAAVIGVLLVRSVVVPLRRVITRLVEVSSGDGDLTQRLDASASDETGELAAAVNAVLDDVSSLIGTIQGTTHSLTDDSAVVSDSAESIANNASRQAASIQEISAAVAEARSSAGRTAEATQEASDLSTTASSSAERGSKEVERLSTAMNGITESSREMAGVIKVIDEIAFQTNLLALNAAVEAARAGDAGKGFAVVAEEVRALAQRSAEAARETNGLIETSMERAEDASTIVSTVVEAFGSIAESSETVAGKLEEVLELSRDQRSGIEDIARGATEIDDVAQASAAGAEELAATAGSTRERTREMADLVDRYRVE